MVIYYFYSNKLLSVCMNNLDQRVYYNLWVYKEHLLSLQLVDGENMWKQNTSAIKRQ